MRIEQAVIYALNNHRKVLGQHPSVTRMSGHDVVVIDEANEFEYSFVGYSLWEDELKCIVVRKANYIRRSSVPYMSFAGGSEVMLDVIDQAFSEDTIERLRQLEQYHDKRG